MSEVLMTLGTVRFSLEDGAYRELSRELEIRVGRQERARGQTARQALGQDETLEIRGVVFGAYKGGAGRVESFRALARTRQPQMLTDGTGTVWGRWLIERVSEEATEHLSNGQPLKQAFRLALGFYGDDT